MLSKYYPRRLTNLPRKKREGHHTLTNQSSIIELFTPWKLFVCLVNLIESLLGFRLETCLKIILQLTYFSCQIVDSREKCLGQNKKMSLKIKAKLFEDKQNFIFFTWGQAKL